MELQHLQLLFYRKPVGVVMPAPAGSTCLRVFVCVCGLSKQAHVVPQVHARCLVALVRACMHRAAIASTQRMPLLA